MSYTFIIEWTSPSNPLFRKWCDLVDLKDWKSLPLFHEWVKEQVPSALHVNFSEVTHSIEIEFESEAHFIWWLLSQ